MKIVEFANNVEAAHNEPPQLDLHCLLTLLNMKQPGQNIFSNFVDINFVVSFMGLNSFALRMT